jgi:hypothetical protein
MSITNPKRTDGFGAQFQTIIYAAIIAELYNLEFAYTPFKMMEHNYDNDPNFLELKENLINFRGSFKINTNIVQPENAIQLINMFENNLITCANSNTLKKIKEIFRENKTIHNEYKKSIAIHIRRPNSNDNRIEGADVSNSVYIKIIEGLKIIFPDHIIHIHSQGREDDFVDFVDCKLHLNDSVENTFTDMVLSDILVTAPSSFSYVAGLLSNGKVYYIPFWHKPLPHWSVLGTSYAYMKS